MSLERSKNTHSRIQILALKSDHGFLFFISRYRGRLSAVFDMACIRLLEETVRHAILHQTFRPAFVKAYPLGNLRIGSISIDWHGRKRIEAV